MKNTIKTSIIIIIGLLTTSQTVFASSAVLSTLPLSATNTVGTSFNVSIQINPSGNNVCVVKGTINFDNLSCQSISLSNGLMAQTVPTCDQPNFTIGIPKCTLISQNLFSVSVKGSNVGQENLSLSGVKIIGAGTDVAFTSQPGIYNIISAVQLSDKIPPVINILGANPMFVMVGDSYIEQGATAIDNVDGNISSNIKIEGEVNTSVVKSYQVTYSVMDKAGNKISATRTVVVNPARSTESGIEIPSGIGELNPIIDNGEKVSMTSVSSSSSASTTENKNGFIATAIDGFSNVSNKLTIALTLIVLLTVFGLYLYNKRKGEYDSNNSDTSKGL